MQPLTTGLYLNIHPCHSRTCADTDACRLIPADADGRGRQNVRVCTSLIRTCSTACYGVVAASNCLYLVLQYKVQYWTSYGVLSYVEEFFTCIEIHFCSSQCDIPSSYEQHEL